MPGPPPVSGGGAEVFLSLCVIYNLLCGAGLVNQHTWILIKEILRANIDLLNPRTPDDFSGLYRVEEIVYSGVPMTPEEQEKFRKLCQKLRGDRKTSDDMYDQAAYHIPVHDRRALPNFIVDFWTGSRVYLGGEEGARNVRFFREEKIMYVVNCANNIGNVMHGVLEELKFYNFDIATTSRFATHKDVIVRLSGFFAFVRKAIESGGNILVHCRAGRHRAGGATCLLLMMFKNWSYAKAYDHIRQERFGVEMIGDIGYLCKIFEEAQERMRRER